MSAEAPNAQAPPFARCRGCDVALQSRFARYCVSCFRARSVPCPECVDAWDKAKRSATRLKPDYRKKGGAQKPCSRCQDARVVLDESPDFRPAV